MESTIRLIQAVIWPAIVVFLLIFFGREVRQFIRRAAEVSLKGPGFEAKFTSQLEAAASLGAASAQRNLPTDSPVAAISAEDARQIAHVVTNAVSRASGRRLSESSVLWVDDRPQNNLYERNALEALGIRVVTATSTDEALEKLRLQSFQVVISDMGRPPDAQAGYTLLEAMKRQHMDIPFIIYAGSNLPEHKALARSKGAIGSTNRAEELFELVLGALRGER